MEAIGLLFQIISVTFLNINALKFSRNVELLKTLMLLLRHCLVIKGLRRSVIVGGKRCVVLLKCVIYNRKFRWDKSSSRRMGAFVVLRHNRQRTMYKKGSTCYRGMQDAHPHANVNKGVTFHIPHISHVWILDRAPERGEPALPQ